MTDGGTVFDALCHLELFPSVDEAARALDAAADAGVTDVVSAGTDPLREERVPASARIRIHRAFGIHPEHVDGAELDRQLAALERSLDAPGVVALGECGLDARKGMPPLDVQERAFAAQLAIARARALPAIVHGVRAPARVLATVARAPGVRWIWHGFAESPEVARAALAAGGVLSVGALAFSAAAKKLHATLAALDDDVLLLETDAPHAALAALPRVAEAVARARGRPVADVVASSRALARAVFGIP